MSTLPEIPVKWIEGYGIVGRHLNPVYVDAIEARNEVLESYAKKVAEAIVNGWEHASSIDGSGYCAFCEGNYGVEFEHEPNCIVLESQKILKELK